MGTGALTVIIIIWILAIIGVIYFLYRGYKKYARDLHSRGPYDREDTPSELAGYKLKATGLVLTFVVGPAVAFIELFSDHMLPQQNPSTESTEGSAAESSSGAEAGETSAVVPAVEPVTTEPVTTEASTIELTRNTKSSEPTWFSELEPMSSDYSYISENGTNREITLNIGTKTHHYVENFESRDEVEAIYFLNDQYTKLTGKWGCLPQIYQYSADECGYMTIYVDGNEVFQSARIGTADTPQDVSVDVTGCKKLKIVLSEDSSGKNIFYDCQIWN